MFTSSSKTTTEETIIIFSHAFLAKEESFIITDRQKRENDGEE